MRDIIKCCNIYILCSVFCKTQSIVLFIIWVLFSSQLELLRYLLCVHIRHFILRIRCDIWFDGLKKAPILWSSFAETC